MKKNNNLKTSTCVEDFIFPLGRFRSYFIPDATGESRVLLEARVASRIHHDGINGNPL